MFFLLYICLITNTENNLNHKAMKPQAAFKVFKKGTTNNWVFILMVDRMTGDPAQWSPEKKAQKMDFYKQLGYTVEPV